MSHDPIKVLIAQMENHAGARTKGEDAPMTLAMRREHARKTLLLAKQYLAPRANPLKVGDVVQWKQGMRNRRAPEGGRPAVVMSILSEVVYDRESEPGSPYFREPLDVICATLTPDGEFMLFHLDSNRLEHYDEFPAEGSHPH